MEAFHNVVRIALGLFV